MQKTLEDGLLCTMPSWLARPIYFGKGADPNITTVNKDNPIFIALKRTQSLAFVKTLRTDALVKNSDGKYLVELVLENRY